MIFFEKYHSGICYQEFVIFDTTMVCVFEDIFVFDIIWIYMPFRNLCTCLKLP